MKSPTKSTTARSRAGRLILAVMSALALLLPATLAVAANDAAQGAQGPAHCEDGGPGHKDCPPENNPGPDNPPCDADHGHPGSNAPKCQDTDPCAEAGGDTDEDGVCDDDDNCPGVANADQNDDDGDGIGDACDTEGPNGDPSCEDGFDNDGDGLTDEEDPDCQDGDPCADAGGDTDGDGVCDNDDNCPGTANADQNDDDGDGIGDACDTEGPNGDPSCEDGFDNDGDGLIDEDDPDCAGTEVDPCSASNDDAGLLTDDTLAQTGWDSGLDALSPLTEDPDRDGAISGPVGELGQDTEAEVVFDEVSCAVDLIIDSDLGGDL